MAHELKVQDQTGATCYDLVYNAAGQIWNVGGGSANTFTTPASASLANYLVTVTEQGTMGFFLGSFPSGISTPGEYWIYSFEQQGASAAIGDILIENGTRILYWNGSAEVAPGSFPTAAGIVTALYGTNADNNTGSVTFQDAVEALVAYLLGKYTADYTANTVGYHNQTGTGTPVIADTLTVDGSGRPLTRTPVFTP